MRYTIFFLCAGLFFGGCNRKSKNLTFYTDIPDTKVKVVAQGPAAKVVKEVVKVETDIPKVINTPLNITVYFPFDSDVLTPKAIDKLEMTIDLMAGCKKPIGLIGGACEIGPNDYNYDLGTRRATAVFNYIKGHVNCTLLPSSVGETHLISTDPNSYYLNRRVEIKELE